MKDSRDTRPVADGDRRCVGWRAHEPHRRDEDSAGKGSRTFDFLARRAHERDGRGASQEGRLSRIGSDGGQARGNRASIAAVRAESVIAAARAKATASASGAPTRRAAADGTLDVGSDEPLGSDDLGAEACEGGDEAVAPPRSGGPGRLLALFSWCLPVGSALITFRRGQDLNGGYQS